jgi:hypothetical protein
MAEKSFAGGMMALYGVAIGNALSKVTKGQASVEDLVTLRDQAKVIVAAQGDLVAALGELETEIARRGTVKAGPEPASERFVAQIDGLSLPDSTKAEIEKSLQTAAMAEIAKIDTGGDMVASPLSRIKAFGPGIGSHTPGIAIVARHLNLK